MIILEYLALCQHSSSNKDSAQRQLQSFHYNDQNMSHLLTAQIGASDAVGITFSALGSTEDLTQTGISAGSIDDNRHHNVMSPIAISTETFINSLTRGVTAPITHLSIVPELLSYGIYRPMMSVPQNRVIYCTLKLLSTSFNYSFDHKYYIVLLAMLQSEIESHQDSEFQICACCYLFFDP